MVLDATMNSSQRKEANWYYFVPLAALGFMTIVMPNSNRSVSLPLFFVAAFTSAIKFSWNDRDLRLLAVWSTSTVITMFYLLLAAVKGYSDAANQVVFVYIVSPALWILIAHNIFRIIAPLKTVNALLMFGFIGAISVFIFYFVFLTYGSEPLTWLILEPNVQLGDGQAGAAMHVFGSLMFICGGFFAAPQVARNPFWKIVLAVSLITAALLSGRSALMISIVIGLILFLFSYLRNYSTELSPRGVLLALVTAVIGSLSLITVSTLMDIDLVQVLRDVADKISEGGGEARVAQAEALRSGIFDSFFLGSGHGVGVSVVRSDDYPWRYELLWYATMFRVGFVGTLVYMIPVFVICFKYLSAFFKSQHSHVNNFMFGGFLAAFSGGATNPYFESFEFQWMIVLPFIYFYFLHVVPKR